MGFVDKATPKKKGQFISKVGRDMQHYSIALEIYFWEMPEGRMSSPTSYMLISVGFSSLLKVYFIHFLKIQQYA